jgi:3-hydroxy-9,10-secoandrosta-1,3,5(10)-triene-9,17-dione monooxygenase
MVEAARRLVPALRSRRVETDELRRLPDESMRDLMDLGMPGVATPRALGGADLGIDGLLEVGMELARGCGSTAWCGGNFAIHNHFLGMFPVEAQQEVFGGDRIPLVATGFSPLRAATRREQGGAVVSGQWDFSSGIDHADWVVVVAMTETGPLGHLVPAAELEVIDTWFTSGLRGTGSKDVATGELFVPEHRLLELATVSEEGGSAVGREQHGTPYYRVPLLSLFGVGIVATILGTARGAIEVFTERTVEKIGGLSGIRVGNRPEVHQRLGLSLADLDAAVTVTRACYGEMRAVGEERDPTVAERVAWRGRVSWAAQTAHKATARLFDIGGAHVLFADDQLNQFYRDNSAAAHHYGIAVETYTSAWGRHALGLEHGIVGL